MKSSYLTLAGLAIIGILCASGSTAAATIENSISAANIAEIARIAEINDIQIAPAIEANLIDAQITKIAA